MAVEQLNPSLHFIPIHDPARDTSLEPPLSSARVKVETAKSDFQLLVAFFPTTFSLVSCLHLPLHYTTTATMRADGTSTPGHTVREGLNDLDDKRIKSIRPLIPPQILMEDYPLTMKAAATVLEGRKGCEEIVNGQDDRLLVVVGPCSVHDVKAALEYAKLLKEYADGAAEDLHILMRVYFEKVSSPLVASYVRVKLTVPGISAASHHCRMEGTHQRSVAVFLGCSRCS